MNHDELWNGGWAITNTNARRSYNDVERLLNGFRVGKDFRQSACGNASSLLSHFLLEALVDRDRFLAKVECSQAIDQNRENHIPSKV